MVSKPINLEIMSHEKVTKANMASNQVIEVYYDDDWASRHISEKKSAIIRQRRPKKDTDFKTSNKLKEDVPLGRGSLGVG
jgi:hypothetical protein